MYKVFVGNELFCDSRVEDLAILNPKIKLEDNVAGTFTFVIPPTHPKYSLIKKRTSIITVYRDNETEPTFEGTCVSDSVDFYNQKSVSCEGSLSFLNDSYLRPARRQGYNTRQLLSDYIAEHNAQADSFKQFAVGAVTVQGSNLFRYTNYQSTMKEIEEDLIDDLGGHLRIRHSDGVRYLDYLAESPNTNTQTIELGVNLTDFESNIDTLDLITGIIPLGNRLETSSIEGLEERLTIKSVNDNKDYLISSASDNLGLIFGTVTWDDVTTASELKLKAQKYLQEEQFDNVVIECKAVDLHLTDFNIEKFKLLDMIRVKSPAHGLDRNMMITKMELNLNDPQEDTLTLGTSVKTSISARTLKANSEIMKKIDEIKPSEMLEQAKDNASQLIQTASNGFVTTKYDPQGRPSELLIMDTADIETATKVWRWNVNGLGYSKNGYNGTYGTAITMDGAIVADFIAAGVLRGIEISNGNGTFHVDANGNVTSKHLTATDIYSSGNVAFNTKDTQNGGIYSNANISCDGNIVGKGTLDITKGATLRDGCTVTGVISATDTISSDAGLNANGTQGIYSGGNIVGKGTLDITEGATLRDGCTVTGVISATDTISSDAGLNANGTQGIYSGGNIYSAGTIATPNWSSASDRRLKQDIEDIPEDDALALLNNMNPRYYKFKSDPETERTGFIAQEVLEVLENSGLDTSLFVQTITNPMTHESHYGLNYTDMVAILWKGWQKHEEEIKALKAEIAEMKGE